MIWQEINSRPLTLLGSTTMDACGFVDKWQRSRRSERSASQEHFLDLCEVLKHPKPGAVDLKGLTFTTERGVKKEGETHGFADARRRQLVCPPGTPPASGRKYGFADA